MTHDERAREWLENDGGSDSTARRNALAAEFAEVEREAQARIDAAAGVASALDAWEAAGVTPRSTLMTRIAVLEAALSECAGSWYGGLGEHADEFEQCWEEHNDAILSARAALSGEPTALLKRLIDAAREGLATRGEVADPEGWCHTIAKRVAGVE